MGFPWVIVGGTGYDVEDIDHAQTRDMVCPSCEKHVRFVEKELVKNLRVFGVALIGVEKGKRVFECPRCKACIEPPAGERGGEAPRPAADVLHAAEARLDRARFEAELWRRRVTLAREKRDGALGDEAESRLAAANRDIDAARAELERLNKLPEKKLAREEPARPAIVARAGGEVIEQDVASEFAALRARLARKQIEDAEAEARERERATEPDDAREGESAQAAIHEAPGAREELASSSPTLEAPEPTVPPPARDELADEVAALRARLVGRAAEPAPRDDDAYHALKREMTAPPAPTPTSLEVAPSPTLPDAVAPEPPAPATAPATAPADDDPIAALKRKLRKPGA